MTAPLGTMPCLAPAIALLAQGRYEQMSRHFREGGENADPATFALFVVALLAILVVILVAARVVSARHAPGYHSPRALFQELSRLHGLDWTSRSLLKRLALQQGLETPSLLFLEPDRLASHRLVGPLESCRPQIASIAQVLFAPPTEQDERPS